MLPGDIILWKGEGFFSGCLGLAIKAFIDPWWDRWAWHVGYIVEVYASGEIVTSQAIANGIQPVTYDDISFMGNVRIYRWLPNASSHLVKEYASSHYDLPYDGLVYLWTMPGALSMRYFNHPFRIVNKPKMCWENVSEMTRYMGKELQPEHEPCLISRIQRALEKGGQLIYETPSP